MTTAWSPSEARTRASHWPGHAKPAASSMGTSPRLRSPSHCLKKSNGSPSGTGAGARSISAMQARSSSSNEDTR